MGPFGGPDPQVAIDPISMTAAQSGSGNGTDPYMNALVQALAQIQQLQTQPLIPNTALGTIAGGLQGAAAGYSGHQNPMFTQALAERGQQLNALGTQATIATHLAQLDEAKKKEERQAQQHKTDLAMKLSQPLMASDDPAQQQLGGRIFINEMQRLGYQVPPDAAKAFGAKSLKPADINEIAKLLLPGTDIDASGQIVHTPGMSVESVAQLTGRPVEQIKLVAAMPDTEQWRTSIGTKTNAAIQKEQIELAEASQKRLKSQFEWLHPEVNREVQAQVKIMFPGKYYSELTDAQQAQAVKAAEDVTLIRQNRHLDYATNVALDKPMAAAQKDKYIDPNTYRPVTGPLSQRQADANGLPSIDDPQTRRSLPAMRQLFETTQRVADIHARHPEYWPPSTGNLLKDQMNLAIARATMASRMNTDPDLGTLKSMMADLPKLATTAGASARFSNFVAELEKNAAGWDQVATRESKAAQLQGTMTRMAQSLTDLGLNPPPRIVRLPNGKEVRVPWNAGGQ